MIYVIGDSFTWGDEISDHLIPRWPGFRTDKAYSDLRQTDWMNNRGSYLAKASQEIKNNHEMFRLKNRWTTILENDLGTKVFNVGECGKSTAGFLTRTVHDFLNFQKENIKIDLMIVQLTSVPRYQIPTLDKEFEYQLWHQSGYYQLNPALGDMYKNSLNKDLFNSYRSKTLADKEHNIFYDFLNNIAALQLLAKLYTGRDLVIVQSVFKEHTVGCLENTNKELANHSTGYSKTYFDLVKNTNMAAELNKYPTMQEILETSSDCKWTIAGHVCAKTHELFGKMLVKRIKEDGLL